MAIESKSGVDRATLGGGHPPATPRRAGLRIGLTVLSLGAGVAGQYWLTVMPQPWWAAGAWALAVAAATLLYFAGRDAAELPRPELGEASSRAPWLWLAVILVVGGFFVFFRIGEIPAGLNHDAAWEGLYAIRILQGEPYTPYTSEAWGRETLTFYFRAASVWLFGPTLFAVQAPGLLAGVLILPFFYVWGRTMFGVRLALVATLFLAASGWHLVFSRTGWRSDFQPFFMAVTCCYFVRGLQTAKPLDFFLSGLGLAATLNIYNGARLFPAIFPLWVLLLLAAQAWTLRGFVRRYGVGIVFMTIAFGIAIAPLAWYAVHNWETFQGRAMALRGASSFGDSLRATLLLFNRSGNGDDFFVDEPALEVPTAVLFVFGLWWTILRCRDQRAQFLLLGMALNLIPGLVSKPNLNRDIGTMVFVYMIVGLGASFFAQQLRRAFGGAGKVVAGAVLVSLAVASMVATYLQYLGDGRRPIWGYYPETTVLGEYMHGIVPDYAIWVGGANFPRDSLTYLSYQGEGMPHPNYVWLEDVRTLRTTQPQPPAGKGLAFLLANEGHGPQVLNELAARYPNHTVEDVYYPREGGKVFARALLVPPSGAPAAAIVDPAPAPAAAAESAAGEVPAAVAGENPAVPGEFRQPRGVAVAPDGTLVATDFGHHRVQRMTRGGGFVAQWGSEGDQPGHFKEPTGIAVGPQGQIAVADTWNGRVQLFSPAGEFLAQSAERLYGPRGVAFSPDGSVVVADTGNNRIVRLAADGALLGSWGAKGSEEGQFSGPVGITVASDGSILVADNGNSRLQIWSKDGQFLSDFPVAGWADAVYSEPYATIDRAGRIWVSVPLAQELRVYDREGNLLRTVAREEAMPAPFETPLGLAYDPQDDSVVVSDVTGRFSRVAAATPAK